MDGYGGRAEMHVGVEVGNKWVMSANAKEMRKEKICKQQYTTNQYPSPLIS